MINRKIAVVLTLAFVVTFGYGLILPSLSLYAHSLGASRSFIGLIVSIYALAQLLTQIPAGRFADRLGRKNLLLVGFTGISVAAMLNNFGTGPNQFFLFQALAGASTGCLWPSLMAVLSEESKPNMRGKLMGTFSTIFFLGMGIGPYVGGQISTTYGFLASFNLWSLSAVVGGIFSALTFQAAPRRTWVQGQGQSSSKSGKLIQPGLISTFLVSCVMRTRGGFCASFNNSILPLYVAVLFNATPKMIGTLMLVHSLGLAFFNIPGGIVADRVGRKWPAIAGALVATSGVFWYNFPGAFWMVLAAVALAGGGSAFASPALSALTADISNPERRAEAFGYFLTSFHVGVIMGSTVFGVVADIIDLSGAVLAWSFTSLTLSLLGLLIRERGSVTVTVNLSQEAAQGAAHS